jgi:murein DD-endopeptidase MepM/ murein hydrolase activator NlpD
LAVRLFLALLLGLFALPVCAEPALSVTGNAYEGSALFVRLSGSEGETPPAVEWESETYEMVPASQGEWESVIPISLDAGGSQTLKVSSGEESWNRTLQVKKRNYGHQSISLNPATLASYDKPQNKADDQTILDELEADRTSRLFGVNFQIPVEAPETTGFGLRRTYNGWRKGWHKGLDLAGWEGEAVASPTDAVVLHTARGVVNGNTVVLSHGAGVGSVYMHLNSIQVRAGQEVKQGQVIGTVGGTGGFAPHLHWEVRVHGVPVNPKLFFQLPKSWVLR